MPTNRIERNFLTTTRKKVKGIKIGKKELKLFLFADDINLHGKNPKEQTHIHKLTLK